MNVYRYKPQGTYGGFGSGNMITPAVKLIIMINVLVFLTQELFSGIIPFNQYFGLVPVLVKQGMIWQIFTYMFLHGGWMHIIFNMFFLWMFGSEIERHWGTTEFLKYFFITGIGAGICAVVFNWNSNIPTVGASGAIYGILLAYGMMFPDRLIYFWFLIPIKTKYFVMILGGVAFMATLNNTQDGISHIAHLSGMVIGLVYLKTDWRLNNIVEGFRNFVSQKPSQPKNSYGKIDSAQPNDLRRQIDKILDRINEVGYENLTDEERHILTEASRRLSEIEHPN